jgi:hypothetical protein
MARQRWSHYVFVPFAVVFVVLLPITLPVIAVLDALDQRRMRTAANTFACLSCGSILGGEALKLADEAWRQSFIDMHSRSPGFRLLRRSPRIVRHLYAICPRCGARFDYVHRQRTFVTLGKGERGGALIDALAVSPLRDVDLDREPYRPPVRDVDS